MTNIKIEWMAAFETEPGLEKTRHFSNHSIRFLFVTICNFLRLRLYLQPSIRIHVLFHSFPKYTFFIKMEKIKRAT